MNSRERILLGTLLSLLVVGGGVALAYFFVFSPLAEQKAQNDAARNELNNKSVELAREEKEIEKILKRDPRLREWEQISLPDYKPEKGEAGAKARDPEKMGKHLSHVQVLYGSHLSEILTKNGFRADAVTITPKPPDSKSSPPLQGKTPAYTRLPFVVQGHASFLSLVRVLEAIHRDPLLHQVRGLVVRKPQTVRQGGDPNDLDITLTVEALMVTGAATREKLLPDLKSNALLVLAEPARHYEDILGKNIFLGQAAANSRITEDKRQVLGEVILTSVYHTGTRWEATFYNQGQGPSSSKMVNERLREFTIKDKYDTEVLKGEVVYLEDHMIVFESGGKYYKMQTGDFMYPAIEKPLKESDLKEFGIKTASAR